MFYLKIMDQIQQQLQDLAEKGTAEGVITPEEAIKVGNRMQNSYLRELITKYQEEGRMDDKGILMLVVALDDIIEKGLLTNDLLDEIQKDPNLLKK
jgi:hypothetical protein